MHNTVLLQEAVQALNLKENSIVVDCTLGYAGHSFVILKNIPKGYLYAFDQDKEAIKYANNKLKALGNNYEIINTNFENLKEEITKRNAKVDGILFDLGVSSPQLDNAARGFSFHQDAPLDMRMNQTQKFSAWNVVNEYEQNELINIFYKYGEEKYASSIAKNIIKNRPINTTLELAELIKESVPEKYRKKSHPARKVFQAIRIEVNNELGVFEKALDNALELINVHGRVAVITFHSLEDRICKQKFKEVSTVPQELKKLPVIPDEYKPKYKVVANIVPSDKEIAENHRARSARLRVIERVW